MSSLPPPSPSSPGSTSERREPKPGRARQRQLARQARRQKARTSTGRPAALPEISGLAGVWARIRALPGHIPPVSSWRLGAGQLVLIAVGLVLLVALFSVGGVYASGNVLPGVYVSGLNLSGLSAEDAAAALLENWQQVDLVLRDGEREWRVAPAELGFQIDAVASAQRAVNYGRQQNGLSALIGSLLSGVELEPVVTFNVDAARSGLLAYAPLISTPPENATIQLQGRVVTHIAAQAGSRLDIARLLPALSVDPASVIERGVITLPMLPVAPAITDATPLVAFAQALIEQPLNVSAYDPVSDDTFTFSAPPETWASWLNTRQVHHPTGPRLYLSVSGVPVQQFLQTQADTLPEPLTIDVDEGVHRIQDSIANGSLSAWVTVRYLPTVHTVERGETAYSISRSTGIPFYLIEEANADVDLSELYVGDQIALPSRDIMLPLPPIPGKRIVVDLSEQYLWAYEDGQVVFEWPISSGVASAPTSTGVFQILSHEPYAYGSSYTLCDEETCGQWVMHWFMGVYEAVPGLMNGFHGAVELPNGSYLGGGQVGRPFTFGCIMSVESNAELLYNWAEEGVVVEIRE